MCVCVCVCVEDGGVAVARDLLETNKEKTVSHPSSIESNM